MNKVAKIYAIKNHSLSQKLGLVIVVLHLLLLNGTAQSELSIMSFNVRYDEELFHKEDPKPTFWRNRKHLQVEVIKMNDPDIVGMQEPHLHQLKYLEQHLPSLSWVGVGRGDGKIKDEFNPIFYKKAKLRLLDWGTFWLSETPEKPSRSWGAGYDRICTWALFQHKQSKKEFYVLNTHFDSKGRDARLKSAELINEKISEFTSEVPTFVMGDFNFHPDSEPYTEITRKYLKDSRKLTQKILPGPEGTFNGFRFGAEFKNRIDFIFVNEKIRVEEYGVINFSRNNIYPSDHFPVLIKTNLAE